VSLSLREPETASVDRAVRSVGSIDPRHCFRVAHALLFLFLLLLLPAAYVENEGLSGARKRSAEGDFDDSDSSGEISLGSDDTPPTMSSAAKKPTTGKASAKASATSSTATPKKPVDPEFIAHMMEKMKLTGVETRGFNFDCVHPYFWWTYSYQQKRYFRIELLCWSSPAKDVEPKISPDGWTFYLSQKIPAHFLDMYRLFMYYNGELPGDPTTCADTIYQEALATEKKIEEHFNMQDIKPLLSHKLPFACSQVFDDPYRPNQVGYQLSSFPHERPHDAEPAMRFHVFSASLAEAAAPRMKPTVQHHDYAWGPANAANNAANANP